MTRTKVFVRLGGDLPPSEELTKSLGVTPTSTRRRGMPIGGGELQPADHWGLQLASWEGDHVSPAIEEQMREAARTIHQMAPVIASLDRDRCTAELYVSTIRDQQQGGIKLISDLIAAAAEAKLDLVVSILVLWDDDEDDATQEVTPPSDGAERILASK